MNKLTAPGRPRGPETAQARGKRAGKGCHRPHQANFIYFWPLYTGQAIPIDDWRSRMWLDTWV
ncbi:hypothetical protein GCM10010321_32860 [Streptomyces chartreusis]|nr:hypothetical protein GCM10010321_32860 [Streptomyces chartreusis]